MISCREEERQLTKAVANKDSVMLLIGRYLFYDRRLSVNNTRSCATCHNPAFAFTDGYKRSLGAFADLHQRNTQALFNLSDLKYLTAADSTLHTPLEQMHNPLLNEHPVEMGTGGKEEIILQKLVQDPLYVQLFSAAGESFSWKNITQAISLFTLSLRSYNSPYDRFKAGNQTALNNFEMEGMKLFFSARLKCSSCHGGSNFSTPARVQEGDTVFYFNTGLYDIDLKGSYPAGDQGLFSKTNNRNDMGKFRVPSLRNLAFTGPYFHDGSAASLGEIIDIYAAGGRVIIAGENKGDGRHSIYKDSSITGFTISLKKRSALLAFLFALSDTSFIHNPALQNPFTKDETEKKY